MMNTSIDTKFDPGDLVKVIPTRTLVWKVEASEQRDRVPYHRIRHGTSTGWVKEEELRPLTFSEFLLYRDPITNGLKIGKNKALPLLIANAMGLVFIGCAFTIEGPWKFGPLIVGLGIIAVTLIGTWRNYTGKNA